MRSSPWRGVAVCSTAVVLLSLAACDRPAEQSVGLVEPQLAAKPVGCDFGSMAQDARSYFPGKGKGSINGDVQDLIKLMQTDCAAGARAAYTGHWFEVAAHLEKVLEDGDGGAAADGASFLAASVSVLGPDGLPIFAPCGTSTAGNCVSWEGYPALPDFVGVLAAADGAWAVPSLGDADAVCSSFIHPCINPQDAWGVSPSSTWGDAFYGRATVVLGQPLDTGTSSPTGEDLLDSTNGFQWLIIPHVDAFGHLETGGGVPVVTSSSLNVGLCSAATAAQEALVQKGGTILTETVLPWCNLQQLEAGGARRSTWDRLLAFVSPAPAPLMATMGIKGPGGSAGSFTDFYGVDVPADAVLALSAQPAAGTVGQPVLGQDGQTLAALTHTQPHGTPPDLNSTPIEDAFVTITVIGNNGLVPSGNDVSASGLDCADYVCTGFTDADEEAHPGSLLLELVFTKPGQYSLCLTAQLTPLTFNQVCSDKFVVNP